MPIMRQSTGVTRSRGLPTRLENKEKNHESDLPLVIADSIGSAVRSELSLAGCATGVDRDPRDPFEDFNRSVYSFNECSTVR